MRQPLQPVVQRSSFVHARSVKTAPVAAEEAPVPLSEHTGLSRAVWLFDDIYGRGLLLTPIWT
jgi:hypothetical protein